ncbi:uncharacterized protein N7483_007134, partial [Penicillium malachiteum]|uniref:uncharacterized protein n=1 Tax=Penicillium malachiteum TaxID=1324776 RepID=UPI002547FDC8
VIADTNLSSNVLSPLHISIERKYTMFGLAGRRSTIVRSKCLTSAAIPARAAPAVLDAREFHSTSTNAASRPTWMPMRVKTPWIDALTQSREATRNSRAGVEAAPLPKPDVTPKRMSDSRYSAILPLAQDKWLLDTYLNASGHIRLGSLLMDLDALAGVIAHRHTGDGVTTVTAAVDRITIENPLMEICDLELSGQVTYATGRSSMEISCQVTKARPEGQEPQPEDVLITCAFTMVSLDPATKKPARVAPLLIETDEERLLYKKGEENSKAKKALRTRSLLEKAPDDEESNLIHSMWTKEMSYLNPENPVIRPENQVFMSETVLKSAMIMQPQDRNRHNFMIFVAYTEPEEREGDSSKYTRVQVRVDTKVRDVEHGTKKSTGMFNYTFLVEKDINVMPKSYGEFMLWTDARRRALNAAAIDPGHKTSALRTIKDSVTE